MKKSGMNSQLLFPCGDILRVAGEGIPIAHYHSIKSIIHVELQNPPVRPPPGFTAPTFMVDNGKYDTIDYHWISVLVECYLRLKSANAPTSTIGN